jgi:hypothetical protein
MRPLGRALDVHLRHPPFDEATAEQVLQGAAGYLAFALSSCIVAIAVGALIWWVGDVPGKNRAAKRPLSTATAAVIGVSCLLGAAFFHWQTGPMEREAGILMPSGYYFPRDRGDGWPEGPYAVGEGPDALEDGPVVRIIPSGYMMNWEAGDLSVVRVRAQLQPPEPGQPVIVVVRSDEPMYRVAALLRTVRESWTRVDFAFTDAKTVDHPVLGQIGVRKDSAIRVWLDDHPGATDVHVRQDVTFGELAARLREVRISGHEVVLRGF